MDDKERILIVDDDKDICRSLMLIFETKGYETETAKTGREAIERAQRRSFNVALLDIRLPDLEGIELLAPLKEMHPDIMVIMITAYASLESAVRALNEGASGYIIKPLNTDEVLANVREALEKQQLLKGTRRAEEALRQRNYELSLLHRASQLLASTLDLDQVLTTIVGEVHLLLNVISCSVWLIDPETHELVCRQAAGSRSEVVRGWRLAPGQGIAGWVARSGESLIVSDTRTDERHFKGVEQQSGVELRSILSVPLRVKDEVIGVLEVLDKEVDRFQPAHLRVAEALAASAAVAVENARLHGSVVAKVQLLSERMEQMNKELIAARSWRSKIADMVLGGVIGALISIAFVVLLGLG
jgi:DNA-binding response OmpR family regulator